MAEFKRFCIEFDSGSDEVLNFDVVIIGTGVAGLYTAVNLDKKLKVALVTKETMQVSNTNLAQGGIVQCHLAMMTVLTYTMWIQ